jgi:hypothetical protein
MSTTTDMKSPTEHIAMDEPEAKMVENSKTPTPLSEEELEPVVDAKTWVVVAVRCSNRPCELTRDVEPEADNRIEVNMENTNEADRIKIH